MEQSVKTKEGAAYWLRVIGVVLLLDLAFFTAVIGVSHLARIMWEPAESALTTGKGP